MFQFTLWLHLLVHQYNNMPGLTSGLNPDVVKTSLDEVLYTEFEREQTPGFVGADNPIFFKQESIDRGAVQYAEYSATAEWSKHAEEQERQIQSVETANKTTVNVDTFKQTVTIPDEFFEDDLHSEVNQTIADVGRKGRQTVDHDAINNSYADGFDGNKRTTPDGNSLYNNSHTALDGSTIDNLETGALSPDNLKTLIRSLVLQKDQQGELGGHVPAGLLVPHILFPEATEVTKSELAAQTGNNDLNYFSQIYPGLVVGNSGFLDSTFNSATNADTSYYVVSRNHRISRTMRRGMKSELVPPTTDLRDRWIYKTSFRHLVVPKTWEGTVASQGTT